MRTEVVTRVRGSGSGVVLRTLAPAQLREVPEVPLTRGYRLYLAEAADVRLTDTVTVRGHVCRVAAPPDLRAGHALVVDVGEVVTADSDLLDCEVVIGGVGVPAFNSATGQTETTTAAAYTGPAAVTTVPTSDGRVVDAAEEQADDRVYAVTLPAGAGDAVEVDHVVEVTAAPNTELVGQRLIVTSVARPGHEIARVLFARLYD